MVILKFNKEYNKIIYDTDRIKKSIEFFSVLFE